MTRLPVGHYQRLNDNLLSTIHVPTMPSPSQTNSILNLLNPYASVSRSTRPSDPDSPSTLLLRELAGDEHPSPPSPHSRRELSPTPTNPHRRPSHVISNSSTSSEDEDAPPRSLVYGEESNLASRRSGERTPRSPRSTFAAAQSVHLASRGMQGARTTSPGPFQPPSSSTSARSRSTSPGPSTISIYASGLEGTALNSNSSIQSMREPSTSPHLPRASGSRLTPTFREPPRESKKPSSSTTGLEQPKPTLSHGNGYLDPKIPNVDRKGKGKAKNQGGRKYVSLPAAEPTDEDEEGETVGGRYAGFGVSKRKAAKAGLDDYEKALWSWVNVDDLDGFLQEVISVPTISKFKLILGIRVLQRERDILHRPRSSSQPTVSSTIPSSDFMALTAGQHSSSLHFPPFFCPV